MVFKETTLIGRTYESSGDAGNGAIDRVGRALGDLVRVTVENRAVERDRPVRVYQVGVVVASELEDAVGECPLAPFIYCV